MSSVPQQITGSFAPMAGATTSTVGSQGAVPTPLAGNHTQVLKGNATWSGVHTIGTGTPQSVVIGSIGDSFFDTTGVLMYIKTTGNNTNTGWVQYGGNIISGSSSLIASWSALATYVTGDTVVLTTLNKIFIAKNAIAPNATPPSQDPSNWRGIDEGEISEMALKGYAVDILGWLKCDGRAISRTTYNRLFTSVGTTYGVGDGSTTFNIPADPSGRALGVSGAGAGLTIRTPNEQVGVENVTLSASEIPTKSHTHPINSLVSAETGGFGHFHNNSFAVGGGNHSHSASSGGLPDFLNGGGAVIQTGVGAGIISGSVVSTSTANANVTFSGGITSSIGSGSTVTVTSNAGQSTGDVTTGVVATSHTNMQPTFFAGNLFIYSGFA